MVNTLNEIRGLKAAIRDKDAEIARLRDELKAIRENRATVSFSLQQELDRYKALYNAVANASRHQAPPPPPPSLRRSDFNREQTCFVELGRFGDIINIFPILRDMKQKTGHNPVVIVSSEFAGLFDGISYADAMPMDLDTTDIQPAIKEARVKFDQVVISQVYARGWHPEKKTPAYNTESWRLAGYLDRWADPALRLVFDRRNYARERALIGKLWPEADKPVIVVNLIGHSSPFHKRAGFQTRLFERWQDEVSIVDLSEFRAERVFDLLGLMELADGIVTTDTATLHLAAATPTPTVALLSDGLGWKQTSPRCNCVLKFTAGDWEKHTGEFDRAMSDFVVAYRSRRVIHAVERHRNDDPRVLRAQASWPGTGWVLAPYDSYVRDALEIGDTRALPFLRDVLEHALRVAKPSDYLVLTNDDNGLADDADAEVARVLARAVMVTGRRLDPADTGHMGRDLIGFRAGWLKHNFDLIPDFILGAPQWDLWAAEFARKLCGVGWSEETSAIECPVCEIRAGAVTHEAHKSYWSQHENDPSAKHNEALRKAAK